MEYQVLKLHLGCGQRYLDGYCNIDFPLIEHSMQQSSVADLHADILELIYPFNAIEEIRLHHVFEHFPRPIACALLAGWFSWLKPGGILRIEVPDFHRTARAILSPWSSFKRKAVAERHLYGSHEARWAVHCEGYTPATLKIMLTHFGYHVVKTDKRSWKGTYSFELLAKKYQHDLSASDLERSARKYLHNHLVDATEENLLLIWMNQYQKQFAKSWAHNG